MKKALIVTTYIPPAAGGSERVAWQIALGLREKFEVHILTTGPDNFVPEHSEEIKDGMMIHYLRYRYPMSIYYSMFGKKYLDEIMLKHNFNVVNTQLILPWAYLLRNYSAKKVITDHAMPSYVYKRNWILNVKEKYNAKAAFRHASAVVSSSKWSAEKIEKDYGVQVQYIPNGIDLKKFYVNDDDERQNVLLFAGRFIEMKGIKFLLEAAEKLPIYEFWFAGEGPLENIIKGANVKNCGFVDKLEDYMRKASVCIFPSFIEASPLVGLEAMACGKPVIATPMGFSDYVEHGKNGLIIEPRSTSSIIKSVNLIMGDRELRKNMGINARETAVQYSWEATCNQYADLFQKVINGKE